MVLVPVGTSGEPLGLSASGSSASSGSLHPLKPVQSSPFAHAVGGTNEPTHPLPFGRLLRSDDFKRLLATPSKARSLHFVVHHLPQRPSTPFGRLSTDAPGKVQPLVDKHASAESSQMSQASLARASRIEGAVDGVWLGCVVPKKHARRAVTRNLLRRQIRQVAQDMVPALQGGLWLVRMRLGFDRTAYPSAASQPVG